MSTKIKELKSEIKALVVEIRKEKSAFKASQKACAGKSGLDLIYLVRNVRHMHIAYCLLRGRTMEQIENKTKTDNAPDMSRVEAIMSKYRDVEPISCGDSVVA